MEMFKTSMFSCMDFNSGLQEEEYYYPFPSFGHYFTNIKFSQMLKNNNNNKIHNLSQREKKTSKTL